MKSRLFVLMLAFLFISNFTLVYPEKTYACSCAGVTPSEAFEMSESVFVGKVLNTKQEREQEGIVGTISYRDANLFEVTQVWKGDNQSQIIVYDNEDSCGIEFEIGKSYLVYASKDKNGELYTGLCNRTTEVSNAGEDLKFLGQGEGVNKEVNLESEMDKISNKDYDMEIFIGGIVAVLTISLFIFKKARRKQR